MAARIALDGKTVAEFCRRHRIRKLALFGSVLRDDFRPDSDVDVLVEFEPGAVRSAFEVLRVQDALSALLGRRVDLVEASAVRNPFRRHEIMRTQQPVYGA